MENVLNVFITNKLGSLAHKGVIDMFEWVAQERSSAFTEVVYAIFVFTWDFFILVLFHFLFFWFWTKSLFFHF